MDINIAIIGKTGVGKSSFCNYIFGEQFSETGSGRPVTGWDKNFSMASTQYKKFKLNIFDSVGLEPDNMPRWSKEFTKFLEQRKISMKVNLDKWLHGVFYLLNTASARLEPVEIDLIEQIQKSGIPLLVILTNIDSATPEQISDLKHTLKNKANCQNIAQVCSVTKKLRGGSVEKYGKEEALEIFFETLYEKIEIPIFECMVKECGEYFDDLFTKIIASVNNMDLGPIALIKSVKNDTNPFDDSALDSLNNIEKKYLTEAEAIISFVETLGGQHKTSFSNKIEKFKEKIEMQLKESEAEFIEEFAKIERELDSDKTWDQIKALGKGLYTVATIKTKITDKLFYTRASISVIVDMELENLNS